MEKKPKLEFLLTSNRRTLSQTPCVVIYLTIKRTRGFIRAARDAVLDHRSLWDYVPIYEMLEDRTRFPQAIRVESWMPECERFYLYRSSPDADLQKKIGPIVDRAYWDIDLANMRRPALEAEAIRLCKAIRKHRDNPRKKLRERTIDDDRQLYTVLPENDWARVDARLPKEQAYLRHQRKKYEQLSNRK